jgi:hypothetical protein
MTNPERRQNPRTTIAGHAYVNIEPNNGGIVLNVSDGGLCFHSFDPVQRNGAIRFWFANHNRRIEAFGTLAWTDETHKGGMRFTALPAEAREQIRSWMSQSTTPNATGEGTAPTGSQPRPFPVPRAGAPETKAASDGSAPLAAFSPEVRVTPQLGGFSRGLATGLLVSAIVVAAVLFQSYRREFGETLIRLGERFATKPPAQTLATPVASAPVVLPSPPAPQMVAQAAVSIPDIPPKRALPPVSKPVQRPEKLDPEPEVVSRTFANPFKPQPPKSVPARPTTSATPTSTDTSTAKPAAKISAPVASSSTPPTPSLPVAAAASGPSLAPSKPGPAPRVEPVNQPRVETESSTAENAKSTSELYFEVGKFKNQSQAHIEIDKLSQLGFPASAVQKGFLWTNSYHILVGPYSDEERAKTTHQNLVSSGFKPRPFERGSRAFTLGSPVTLNGTRTPAGDYIISWESSLDDASVKLLHNDFVVARADGKWVKRDVKYQRDAYVYRRNADGSRTLLEIRFGGTYQALLFGKSS